jgi:RNA polymerase sigma-70 factor (ECF subfamily)
MTLPDNLPTIQEMSDEEALRRAAQGDRESFGLIYDRYITRIYNYIYYRTGNTHDAEDLTSQVFSRALKHITNYQDRGVPFSAWLYRIAHNLVANFHRDKSRKQEFALEDGIWSSKESDLPESVMLRVEQHDEILELIRDIPEDRQMLIILKFVDHMPNAEIGKIMGKTEGAIKSLYHRTLLSLRKKIDVDGLADNGNK